jgi:hypothetical protein
MSNRSISRLALVPLCMLAAASPAPAARIEGQLYGTTFLSSNPNDRPTWQAYYSIYSESAVDASFPPAGLAVSASFTMDAPAFPTPTTEPDYAASFSSLTLRLPGYADPFEWLRRAPTPSPLWVFDGAAAPTIVLDDPYPVAGKGMVKPGTVDGMGAFSYALRFSDEASTRGNINGAAASGFTTYSFGWNVPADAFPGAPVWNNVLGDTRWTGRFLLTASLQQEEPVGGNAPIYFSRTLPINFVVDRLVVRTDLAAIRSSGPVSPCVADPVRTDCLQPVGLPATAFAVATPMVVGFAPGERASLVIEGGAQMTAPQITVDRGGLLSMSGGLTSDSQLTLATTLRVRDGEVQIAGSAKLRVDGAPPPPPPGTSFQSFASVGLGYGGGSALVEVFGSGSELVVSQAGASLAVGTINSADVAGSGVLRADQLALVRTPLLEVGFNGGQGTVEARGGSWIDVYNPAATPVGARLFVGRGGGLGEVFVDGRVADGTRSLLSVRGPSSQAIIGGYNPAASNFAGGGTGSLVVRNGGVARINNLLLVGSGPTGGLPAGKAVPQGELQVLSGGKVEVLGYAEPATNRPALYAGVWGGDGKIVVDGADSTLSVLGADPVVAIDAGQLDAGTAGLGGTGRLEVRNGGLLQIGDAGPGRLLIGARGELVVDNATVLVGANGLQGRTDIHGTARLLSGTTFRSTLTEVHNGGSLCGRAYVIGEVKGSGETALLCPGSSPGQLVIEGRLTWNQGIIELEVESDGSGGFRTDSLLLVGADADDVSLAGAQLRFVFLGNTDPRAFAASALNTPGTFFQLQTAAGPVGLDALVPWATLFAGSTVSAVAEGYAITDFDYDIESGFTAMQAVPVPEPSTLVLTVLGVLAVAARVRRQGQMAGRLG